MPSQVDRRLGATLVLIALAWLWLVYTEIPAAGTEWPGPRGFPLLLGVVLAFLGALMALAPQTANRELGSPIPDPGSRRGDIAIGIFALLILYAYLLERAGFLAATLIIIALTMVAVLRIRQRTFIVGFAAAVSVGCWVVFDLLLGIPLPRGIWIAW
jgi:hypothetical protein